MSLINKMLRDLDARNVNAAERAALPAQVRPLPAQVRGPLVSRGILIFLVMATVLVVGFVTSSYWLQPLLDIKFVSKPPVAAPPPAAPPPTTVVLQLPPPEQMLPMPPLPEAEPAAAAPAETPAPADGKQAAPVEVKQAPPVEVAQGPRVPVSEIRKHNRKMEGVPPELARVQPAAPPVAAPPAQQRPSSKPLLADKSGTGPVTIDKQSRLGRTQEQAELEYRKGVAAYKQGHVSEAATQFRAALREEPRHLASRQTLLSLLAEQKQWDEAQMALKEGLELMPQQIGWAMALARIQVERDNADGAWETLMKYMVYG